MTAELKAWLEGRAHLQNRLWEILGRPAIEVEPRAEVRDRLAWDGVIVEQIVYDVEPGQSVPALLYLPRNVAPPYPAIVIAMGHGESKTTPGPLYAGPLYAKLGIACLVADPNGEEERNIQGRQGTRAHDAADVSARSRAAGRTVVGKMVWDLRMGLSYLQTRHDIDPERLGCAGVSLGGTVAGYLLALDERLKVAIPCGWFFRPADREIGKDCSRIPSDDFLKFMTNGELLGLAAPHCAVLVANGDADTVIDKVGFQAVRSLGESMEQASCIYRLYGAGDRIGMYVVPGGGHRHYYLTKAALSWAIMHLGPVQVTENDLLRAPEARFGDWAKKHGIGIERLYDTEAHFCGLFTIDLGIKPLPADKRRCLRDDEIGCPRYTLEGWLESVERQAIV
jgi:dienelactone hydrolase